ncbi:MAG TPA: hypothetical protein VMD05_08825 [Candidatus Nanoarchaeia archaeon]|nr:hypothetical protein [Candidatus Nanoarchaeia archaeon]
MQATKTDQQIFQSGKIIAYNGDIEVIEVTLKGNEIAVNVENKEFIKRVIGLRNEVGEIGLSTGKKPTENDNTKKKSDGALAMLKSVAETLSSNGITLILSYKGHVAVTLGSEAHPLISQFLTGTKSVALNNFLALLDMII